MKQKILHILLSLVVAFGIWTYVVTVVSPESTGTFYDIPVVLSNQSVLMDRGFMVVSDGEPKMTLQLRGNRSDLDQLKNSDISIVADLSRINAPGEQSLNCNVSFTGNLAFEIIDQIPNRITLEIAEWATKEVPVEVNYIGNLGLDYIVYHNEAVLDREQITVTGPKATVDEITQARIDVDLTGHTAIFSENYRYTLCNAQGQPVDAASVTTNVSQVNLTLRIQRVKEIQLLVDINYGGGATVENTLIVQDYLTIKVSGNEAALNSLGDTLKLGTVDLALEPEDTVKTFKVSLPEGIENLAGIREVTVEITFEGLATKEFYVSKILTTGAPAGLIVDIARKEMPVTLRGPEELIAQIKPEDITVLVGLSGAIIGENLYTAEIVLSKEYLGVVRELGTYHVLVSVKEPEAGA